MNWFRRPKPPTADRPHVEEARAALQATEDRWPLIREAAAALRHQREQNHFREIVEATMRRP